MKRNKIALFLAAIMLTTLFAGCARIAEEPLEEPMEEPVEEPAEEFEEEYEEENYITIDAYGRADGMLTATYMDEVMETGSWDLPAAVGSRLGDVLAEQEITDLDAYLDGDELEGWMVFEIITTTDEFGFDEYTYELRSGDTIYSTEELMDLTVPDYTVCYVAKWAGIAAEDYFAEEDYMFDSVETSGCFTLNAGEGAHMTFLPEGSTEGYESQVYAYWMEDGESLNDVVAAGEWDALVSIEKEGATFTGWTVYEAVNLMWSGEESTEENVTSLPYVLNDERFENSKYVLLEDCSVYQENMSTEDLYNLVNNSANYYAVANWE